MSTLAMPIRDLERSDDPSQLLRQARMEIDAGHLGRGQTLLNAALDVDPSRQNVRMLLAECLHRSGNPLEAARQWQHVLREIPNHTEAKHWLEYVNPLVAALQAVRDRNPKHAQISIRKGVTCVSLGGLIAPRTESDNLNIHYARITNAIAQAAAHGFVKCIVDMQNATFVSSYFHGLVAGWIRQLRPAGGQIVLAGTREEIRHALELAGFRRAVRFATSVKAAQQYFTSSNPNSRK